MSWYPDMGCETMAARGDHVRAVGWLSSNHPFPKGPVPPEFLARLREFVRLPNHSAKALSFPAFAGLHDNVSPDVYERARRCFAASYEVVRVPGGHFMHRESPVEFIAELTRLLRAA